MFKRVRWFIMGAGAGASGSIWAQRQVKAKLDEVTVRSVGEKAARRARSEVGEAPQRIRRSIAVGREAYRRPLDSEPVIVDRGQLSAAPHERERLPAHRRAGRRLGREVIRRVQR